MLKILNRIITAIVVLLLGLGLESCEKQLCEDLLLNNLELENMDLNDLYVLPCNPDSDDQISVIEKICGTETDVILSFQGYYIGYKRYVNSLMMAPCSPQLDTTSIGQLSAGSYLLVHQVIDLNHFISDSIIVQDTIALLVSR